MRILIAQMNKSRLPGEFHPVVSSKSRIFHDDQNEERTRRRASRLFPYSERHLVRMRGNELKDLAVIKIHVVPHCGRESVALTFLRIARFFFSRESAATGNLTKSIHELWKSLTPPRRSDERTLGVAFRKKFAALSSVLIKGAYRESDRVARKAL